MKMFLLFSHKLTHEQIEDAKKSLGVSEFVEFPTDLIFKWGNVEPELESLDEFLEPFCDFLKQNCLRGDYIFISGDFGAVFKMVEFSKSIGLKTVYATTKRESKEIVENGSVKKVSVFKHVRFRFF